MSAPYGYSPPGYGQSHNPYAAPQAFGSPGFAPMGGGGPIAYRAHGGALKWVYLASLLGGIALMVLGGIVGSAADEDVGAALAVLGGLSALFVRLIVSLIWLYGAWSAVPVDYRVTSSGKRVSPGEAVGFLFIPFFNLYWMFVASGGLCDALDFMLRSSGTNRSAPKGLALAGCIFQLVPYMNILIAPFLWFFYMLQVDGVAKELEAAAARGPAAGGPGGGYGAAPAGFGGAVPGGYGAPPAGGYGGAPGY